MVQGRLQGRSPGVHRQRGERVLGFQLCQHQRLSHGWQLYPVFKDMAKKPGLKNSPTTLAITYDGWGPNPNVGEIDKIMALAK